MTEGKNVIIKVIKFKTYVKFGGSYHDNDKTYQLWTSKHFSINFSKNLGFPTTVSIGNEEVYNEKGTWEEKLKSLRLSNMEKMIQCV